MTILRSLAMLLLAAGAGHAQTTAPLPSAEALMTQALGGYPGKEALVLAVTFPPGAIDPIHRHDAHAFVYVLEGSIVMGVDDDEPVTLTVGQTFYEGPDDIHTVGRNASLTEPARFLVVLLKDDDKPFVLPAG